MGFERIFINLILPESGNPHMGNEANGILKRLKKWLQAD